MTAPHTPAEPAANAHVFGQRISFAHGDGTRSAGFIGSLIGASC